MKPTLSVVVPIYNVLDYVYECIQSVINQQVDEIEIILVDDGSTDGSDILIDSKFKNFSNIKIIHQPNGGLSSARNTGIKAATGAYIILLDSDDQLKAKSLIKLVACLNKYSPDCVMVDYIKTWLDGGQFYETDRLEIKNGTLLSNKDAEIVSKVYDNASLYPWRFIFKREIYQQSFFDESLNFEDVRNIPILIAKCKNFIYLKIILVDYLQRPGSILATKSLKNALDLSSSTTVFSSKLNRLNIKVSHSVLVSHSAFSLKIFIWSIKDLLNCDKPYYKYVSQIKNNLNDSLLCDISIALKYLKKNDKKLYTVYKLLNLPCALKVLFFLYPSHSFFRRIINKIAKVI